MYAKKWRFERVIPTLTVAFGIITLGSGWVTNYAGLIGTRLILGWFEGCLCNEDVAIDVYHLANALQSHA